MITQLFQIIVNYTYANAVQYISLSWIFYSLGHFACSIGRTSNSCNNKT